MAVTSPSLTSSEKKHWWLTNRKVNQRKTKNLTTQTHTASDLF